MKARKALGEGCAEGAEGDESNEGNEVDEGDDGEGDEGEEGQVKRRSGEVALSPLQRQRSVFKSIVAL